MIKKVALVVIVFFVLLNLSACGQKKSTKNKSVQNIDYVGEIQNENSKN